MDLERKMIGYGKDKERLWYLCIKWLERYLVGLGSDLVRIRNTDVNY